MTSLKSGWSVCCQSDDGCVVENQNKNWGTHILGGCVYTYSEVPQME